ncbi:hypothetical protein [Peribacillus simplex]|uniref:hypothetical protein n=1 Tax=Peribacillus simplex TaxID=1478 RepID=UPI003CF1BA12
MTPPARLLLVGIGINAAFGAGLVIFRMKMGTEQFHEGINLRYPGRSGGRIGLL